MPDTLGNLLIVDDDVSVRTSLALVFSALGYRARTGEDGYVALSEIRKEIPDVLLSDLNMVGMPGFEFLAAIRRSFPSIRVIAMTGVLSGNRKPPEIAADAFYQKGAGPSRLIEYVDAMTHPMRSVSRLSMESSLGRQVLEPIPSHPGAEQSTHLANRSSALAVPHKSQACESFPTETVTRTQEMCSL
jgi:DNA-binding NtrC family response regulator